MVSLRHRREISNKHGVMVFFFLVLTGKKNDSELQRQRESARKRRNMD